MPHFVPCSLACSLTTHQADQVCMMQIFKVLRLSCSVPRMWEYPSLPGVEISERMRWLTQLWVKLKRSYRYKPQVFRITRKPIRNKNKKHVYWIWIDDGRWAIENTHLQERETWNRVHACALCCCGFTTLIGGLMAVLSVNDARCCTNSF